MALYTYDLTHTYALDRKDPAQARVAWDTAHFVTSIQGIVNRDAPRLYLFFINGPEAKVDRFWLDRFREPEGYLAGMPLRTCRDLDELVRVFRSRLKGVVVYDERVPCTSNLASTIAGVSDLACLRYDPAPGSLYHRMVVDPKGPRLPVRFRLIREDGSPMFTGEGKIPDSNLTSTGSAKCDAYVWARRRFLETGRCTSKRLAYYLDAWWLRFPDGDLFNHTLTNHDFFISERAFFCDLGPWDDETPVDDRNQPLGTDQRTLQDILHVLYRRNQGGMLAVGGFTPWAWKYTDYGNAGGKHGGVESEWRFAEIISCFNGFMDADALGYSGMANASVFRHFKPKVTYPQVRPTLDALKQRGLVLPDGRVAPKSFVAIYAGDYDAAAWVYQRMPFLWTDPERGSIPISWSVNPNLADRFGPGLDYLRRTASPNDVFLAGEGAGYLNPGHLVPPRRFSGLPDGVEAWVRHSQEYYRRWGYTATGFVIDGFAPRTDARLLKQMTRFSPDGIGMQFSANTDMVDDTPIARMRHDFYDPEAGAKHAVHEIGWSAPEFRMYRTILWSPGGLKRLYERIHELAGVGRVEMVDTVTLFALIRQFYRTGAVTAAGWRDQSLWSVQAGLKITAHSPDIPGFPVDKLFDAQADRGPRETIFADNRNEHWVEWEMPEPVTVGRVRIYAEGDQNSQRREFELLRIQGWDDAAQRWQPFIEVKPAHPYVFEDRNLRLLTTVSGGPVTARRWRLDLTQHRTPDGERMGPRIIWLEALAP